MWHWIREQWEQIRGDAKWWVLTEIGCRVATFWTILMTAIVTVWGWVTELQGPTIFVLALAVFTLCLAAIALGLKVNNGILQRRILKQQKQEVLTLSPVLAKEEASGNSNGAKISERPLQNVSYFTLEKISRRNRYLDIAEGPQLISFQILNELHHSDPRATEATGIVADLTYYDLHWKRLFGPMRGCWILGRSTEIYLDADPITLKGQESQDLAIAISFVNGRKLFAVNKESLPFYLWKNPASALAEKYHLRIGLTGDTVQQVLYCHIHHPSDDFMNFNLIQPPEGMR